MKACSHTRSLHSLHSDLISLKVCKQSGYIAGENCGEISEELVPYQCQNSRSCPFCRLIHLDKDLNFRVSADCEGAENIVAQKWFTLPPAMEYYYKKHNHGYKPLPPLKKGIQTDQDSPLQIIYPEAGAKIFLPKGFDGKTQPMIFQAAARNAGEKIFWQLDDGFVQVTTIEHKISVVPEKGVHTVLITDEDGNTAKRTFEIIEK